MLNLRINSGQMYHWKRVVLLSILLSLLAACESSKAIIREGFVNYQWIEAGTPKRFEKVNFAIDVKIPHQREKTPYLKIKLANIYKVDAVQTADKAIIYTSRDYSSSRTKIQQRGVLTGKKRTQEETIGGHKDGDGIVQAKLFLNNNNQASSVNTITSFTGRSNYSNIPMKNWLTSVWPFSADDTLSFVVEYTALDSTRQIKTKNLSYNETKRLVDSAIYWLPDNKAFELSLFLFDKCMKKQDLDCALDNYQVLESKKKMSLPNNYYYYLAKLYAYAGQATHAVKYAKHYLNHNKKVPVDKKIEAQKIISKKGKM